MPGTLTPQQEGIEKVRGFIKEDGDEGGAARMGAHGVARIVQRAEGEVVRIWIVREDGSFTWHS